MAVGSGSRGSHSGAVFGRFILALGAIGGGDRRLAFGSVVAVEQRIALQFGLDIGDEVEIGELQQLDGLHQLRRHHQSLALPKLKSLRKCHGWR